MPDPMLAGSESQQCSFQLFSNSKSFSGFPTPLKQSQNFSRKYMQPFLMQLYLILYLNFSLSPLWEPWATGEVKCSAFAVCSCDCALQSLQLHIFSSFWINYPSLLHHFNLAHSKLQSGYHFLEDVPGQVKCFFSALLAHPTATLIVAPITLFYGFL